MDIAQVLHSWNGPAIPHLAQVQIEDDSLRDGLQGAFMRKPSTAEKLALLQRAVDVGVHAAMLGFPASSAQELDDCLGIVRHIDAAKLPVIPRFLARARVEDVEAIAQLNDSSARDVWADFFLGVSPIRRAVERWELSELVTRIETTSRHLVKRGCKFGMSIEDASRTPADELRTILDAAVSNGAEVLTVCDTVGESTPAGAAALVQFVLDELSRRGSGAAVWWHGHNDRGLATANAIAAAQAGAHVVSGAFLGIGERAGNTALEQVVMFLHQNGNRQFHVDQMAVYCRELAAAAGVDVAHNAPLVGSQAFATCTGTHSAAVLKARELGPAFEDYVFSGVPATDLGRFQEILIGPTSGLANARYMLERLQLDTSPSSAERLLRHAKTQDRWLTPEEIVAVMSTSHE